MVVTMCAFFFLIGCQPIPVPNNGNIDYSVPGGTLIMASVSCSDGYVIRGDTVIYCMNNDWVISETPACMRNGKYIDF